MPARGGSIGAMSFFFDGMEVPLDGLAPAGARLLEASGASVKLPLPGEPPYLFCGNGSCRDCNVLVDGLPDVPSCRLPLAPGMSLRSGEGAGEENALARNCFRAVEGEPLSADLLVVGAGPAGRAAAEEALAVGARTIVLDARASACEDGEGPRPVAADASGLIVYERGRRRRVLAPAVILANGAHDVSPRFAGSHLAGVLPLDLLERFTALGHVPGDSILVVGEIGSRLETELDELDVSSVRAVRDPVDLESVSGEIAVERARLRGGDELEVDYVFFRCRRAPSVELGKALGCRTSYDRGLRCERLVTDEDGATSIGGIFAAGDVVRPGSADDARASGMRAGRAAAALFG